ncbi:hypothetical protein MTR_7g078460 [Medicago truncatula]|uniref:Uncharacterized protein n=1 Tax=Medicago truncatula TaxID=3880 RepID=G7L5R7_MEDTR|nr:hypothetical protein MTR_7g078460 [Medicago truncatula]
MHVNNGMFMNNSRFKYDNVEGTFQRGGIKMRDQGRPIARRGWATTPGLQLFGECPGRNHGVCHNSQFFSCVLELAVESDADVAGEKVPEYFRFVTETEGIGEVRTNHPGVTKIVVRDEI